MPRIPDPPGVPLPVGNYALGVEVEAGSRLLYISGQIPEAAGGEIPADFEGQCRLVWSHIGAVLAAAGMTYSNLVKVNTYLTDRGHAELNGAIRREVLGRHQPTLTVVVVETLNREWLLEIDAVASA